MFHVDWKYHGKDDRVLLLLPPFTKSVTSIEKNPAFLSKIRTTIRQLCSNENIRYIVAHIPYFHNFTFELLEQLEVVYGVEIRILQSLVQLTDKSYTEHISNECIYLLKNENEWVESLAPWEWFFDVCINEQLYQYYDTTSKLIKTDFHGDNEISVGANYVHDSVYASLHMTKKIPFDGNMLRTLAGMHQDFNEGDIVLTIGTLGSYETKELPKIIERYLQESRLTAIYVFGKFQEKIHELMSEYPEIIYHSYTQTIVETHMIEWLWAKYKKHGPKYNSYVFIGSFEIEEESMSVWESLEKPYLKACIYTPESWNSFHPKSCVNGKFPYMISTEPIGLLDYFIDGQFQISEKETDADDYDDYDNDNDNNNSNDKCSGCP